MPLLPIEGTSIALLTSTDTTSNSLRSTLFENTTGGCDITDIDVTNNENNNIYDKFFEIQNYENPCEYLKKMNN